MAGAGNRNHAHIPHSGTRKPHLFQHSHMFLGPPVNPTLNLHTRMDIVSSPKPSTLDGVYFNSGGPADTSLSISAHFGTA